MKRFAIVTQVKEIGHYRFVIPVIKTLYFTSPKRMGAYCADNGTLWTEIDDGKWIFADKEKAEMRLTEIMEELSK